MNVNEEVVSASVVEREFLTLGLNGRGGGSWRFSYDRLATAHYWHHCFKKDSSKTQFPS